MGNPHARGFPFGFERGGNKPASGGVQASEECSSRSQSVLWVINAWKS